MSRRSFQFFTESFPNGKAVKILKGRNGWNSSFVERKCRKLLPRHSRGGVFVLCLKLFTSFSHLFLCLNFALKFFFASCDFGGGRRGARSSPILYNSKTEHAKGTKITQNDVLIIFKFWA